MIEDLILSNKILTLTKGGLVGGWTECLQFHLIAVNCPDDRKEESAAWHEA